MLDFSIKSSISFTCAFNFRQPRIFLFSRIVDKPCYNPGCRSPPYRVSTLGQVEKDDIPMQKQSCREFAERQGWEVCREFSEKGVSGFKVSAANRDAIQQIKEDVVRGKFDVLLVFMFDRIGRIEGETPFVVEWLVQNGIEVWSVNEGQQRFENHVDKLMNYIRFWQASGESEKTSIRTKTRLGQIVKEGRFRGGAVPYGYRIEKQGRVNKKTMRFTKFLKTSTRLLSLS